jgi:hypothetical protein
MPHFITLPVNEKGIVFDPQIDDSIPNGAAEGRRSIAWCRRR